MKKLTRKLFLSCAALCACAATLVSTTFAWYTTNTSVDASNISSASAGTGDSSIFISLDGSSFKQSVDFDLSGKNASQVTAFDGANGSNFGTASLAPVQLLAEGTNFKKMDGSTDKGANDVLYFCIYFKTAKTGADVPLYLEGITLKNKAANLTNHMTDNLLNGTSSTKPAPTQENSSATTNKPEIGVDRNESQYAVDIIDALAMQITTAASTYTAKTPSGSKAAFTNKLNLQSVADTNGIAPVNVGTPNALNYYNEVMEASLSKPVTAASLTTPNFALGSRTQIATLDKDGGICCVKFEIFLDGWDEYCYDACKGQSFTIDLKFSSNNTALGA